MSPLKVWLVASNSWVCFFSSFKSFWRLSILHLTLSPSSLMVFQAASLADSKNVVCITELVNMQTFFLMVVFLVFIQVKLHPPVFHSFIHHRKTFVHSCTLYLQCNHEVLESLGEFCLTLQSHCHEWSFPYGFVDGVHLQIEMREKIRKVYEKNRQV